MTVGRVVSTVTAAVTVAGCALLVVGMARSEAKKQDAADAAARRAEVVQTLPAASIPAQLPRDPAPSVAGEAASADGIAAVGSPSSTRISPATSPIARSAAPSAGPSTAHPTASTTKATPARTSRPSAPTTAGSAARTTPKATPRATTRTTPKPSARPVAHAAPRKGVALPLKMSTGKATRVITVRAHSKYSTTAVLQAWTKAPGGGWLRYGKAVTAHVGSQGLTSAPSESKSATPIGSFTLTRAFGHYSDPGTPLPYVHTTPADWWISQRGPLYNTLQRCSSNCSFTRGSPNEHLYYETPYYNYAVVIDYNTRNAGTVRQGAGSAFFLHVTDGGPTAGCVSISQTKLISLMRWLTPKAHPRILIGVA